jgi:hypothetical protein
MLVGNRVFSNFVKLVTTLALQDLSRRSARAGADAGSAPGEVVACDGVEGAGRRGGEDDGSAGRRERDQDGADDLVTGGAGRSGGGWMKVENPFPGSRGSDAKWTRLGGSPHKPPDSTASKGFHAYCRTSSFGRPVIAQKAGFGANLTTL